MKKCAELARSEVANAAKKVKVLMYNIAKFEESPATYDAEKQSRDRARRLDEFDADLRSDKESLRLFLATSSKNVDQLKGMLAAKKSDLTAAASAYAEAERALNSLFSNNV